MDISDMTSIWLDPTTGRRPTITDAVPLEDGASYDVAVVGAGLTGLTTAVLLARSGCRVVVLEARHVGAVTTGNTTAKISLLQGAKLSDLAKHHPYETVAQYVEGNRQGQAWLTRYCETHDVAYQVRDAVTYATTDDGLKSARAEAEAAQNHGLPVRWSDDVGLGFPHLGGVLLPGQAQLDPVEVLAALVADLDERGVQVYEGRRVIAVEAGSPNVLTVRAGADPDLTVRADHVVLATGIPILDRGGFFARLEPNRSYAAAFRVPGPVPTSMYLSTDSPTRSLRTVAAPDGERLLVGGNGHVVGREANTRGNVEDLVRWTAETFPGAQVTHTWSAQDYRSTSHLPFVGSLTPGSGTVHVATGYDKWGMTNAVAASLVLSGSILETETSGTPWAQAYRSWSSHEVRGAGEAVKINASVGARMVADRVKPLVPGALPSEGSTGAPPEGQGVVEKDGLAQVAVCTVGGRTFRRSATCTHLGGVVTWNDAERSWDCPLHGSRFAPDGEVLEGPAVSPLAARDEAAQDDELSGEARR